MKTLITLLILCSLTGCYRYHDTGFGNASCCPKKFQKYVNVYKLDWSTMTFEYQETILRPYGWMEEGGGR